MLLAFNLPRRKFLLGLSGALLQFFMGCLAPVVEERKEKPSFAGKKSEVYVLKTESRSRSRGPPSSALEHRRPRT